jgi:hypothetical protein
MAKELENIRPVTSELVIVDQLSQPQGHGTVRRNMSLKNLVTPPGIDPGTVRLVAQRLNHYATPGPHIVLSELKI